MNTKRVLRFTNLLVLAAALALAEKMPEQQKPVPLTEIQVLKFENLDLKAKPIQEAAQKIQAEYSALASAVCGDAKIPLDECRIDPAAKTVTRVPKPPAAAAAPPVQNPAKKEGK